MPLDSTSILGFWLAALAAVGAWESFAPLREARGPLVRRWISHVSLMAINTMAGRALFPAAGVGLALALAERDAGLLRAADVPFSAALVIAVVVQDLRGYAWHRLLHASPWLWRAHRVHHGDADLDLTTALRFHPLEALGATATRLLVIAVLGPPAAAVVAYELLMTGSGLAAHANARLPQRLERLARLVLVTPEVHRVHHSAERAEANRNFANVFSFWDRLFGTWQAAPAADPAEMRLGDPEHADPDADRLSALLLQPFLPAPSPGASPGGVQVGV